MGYRVVITMSNAENAAPGGVIRRAQKVGGPFVTREEAKARKSQIDADNKRTYEDRSLPGDVRKRAMESVCQSLV